MKKEVNPKDTRRGEAFDLWMKAPMPMVTLTKTFDVSRIKSASVRRAMSFNMLLCWCIGKAAGKMEEFCLLPENGKLYHYDGIAVNVIVCNEAGRLCSCDIPYDGDFSRFRQDYEKLTGQARHECKDLTTDDRMVIGTSALIDTELDSIVNIWSGVYANPMVMWGKHRRRLFKTLLPISFQFHHVQMDGAEAVRFLNALQEEIARFE